MPKPVLFKKTLIDADMFTKAQRTIDIFFAPDEDYPTDYTELSAFGISHLSRYLNNHIFNTIIDHNASKRGLSKMAMLSAHGGDDGVWMYHDTKNWHKVQTWINTNDGKYSALMLYCCNPGHLEVKSKKSALLLPNDNYRIGSQDDGDVTVELFIPGYGYMQDYDIKDYIKEYNLKL